MTRLKYLDCLKVVLALMVIGLHVELFGGGETLLGYVLVNGVFRVAVPLYFLINGYFLQKSLVSGPGGAEWVKKVFRLYLVWSLIYLPFYFPDGWSGRDLSLFSANLLFGYWHLWYLVATLLGGWGLCRLRFLCARSTLVLAVFLFLFGWFFQISRAYGFFLDPLLEKVINQSWASRNFLFLGLPFMLIGALVFRCRDLVDSFPIKTVFVSVLIGGLFLLAESFFLYESQSQGKRNFDFLLSLLLVCPAAFIAIIRIPGSGGWGDLGRFSSALYLVHPMVILAFVFFVARNSVWYVPGVYFFSVFMAVLVISIRSRFSFLL